MDYDDLERSQPTGSSFVDRRNMRRMGASDGGPSSELEYSHEVGISIQIVSSLYFYT